MKEPMTQKFYDLLVSAGLIEPHPHRKFNYRDYCLCTLKKTGVATWDADKNCLCIIYPALPKEDRYNFVYTQYERI